MEGFLRVSWIWHAAIPLNYIQVKAKQHTTSVWSWWFVSVSSITSPAGSIRAKSLLKADAADHRSTHCDVNVCFTYALPPTISSRPCASCSASVNCLVWNMYAPVLMKDTISRALVGLARLLTELRLHDSSSLRCFRNTRCTVTWWICANQ